MSDPAQAGPIAPPLTTHAARRRVRLVDERAALGLTAAAVFLAAAGFRVVVVFALLLAPRLVVAFVDFDLEPGM